MTPITFPQANTQLLAPPGMNDCGDLPCFRDGELVVSCWALTWRERLHALVFGRVWLRVAGETHPPLALDAKTTVFTA